MTMLSISFCVPSTRIRSSPARSPPRLVAPSAGGASTSGGGAAPGAPHDAAVSTSARKLRVRKGKVIGREDTIDGALPPPRQGRLAAVSLHGHGDRLDTFVLCATIR